MRTSRSTLTLLAAFAALGGFLSLANAQSVATAPVGAVSIAVAANADQPVGITLQRPVLFSAAAGSVAGGVLTVSSIPSLGSDVKYVKFLSGSAVGQWVQVASSTSTTITLTESAQSLGVVAGDKFEVRPFWTLGTLFPQGAGIPQSDDITSPVALVLLNDPTFIGVNLAASSAYFYHDGSLLAAGWYNNDGSFANSNDTIVSPESSIVINNSTALAAKVVTIGDVPTVKVATSIVARVAGDQDNLIYNPYPAAVTLAASGLASSQAVRPSADITSPGDLLLVYSSASTDFNPAAADVYFYHDGSLLSAGWYKNDGSFESADATSLAVGAAIIIRKVGGASAVVDWTPAVPYTL